MQFYPTLSCLLFLSYEMNDCRYSYNATTRVEEIVCRTWLMAPLMILNGVIIGAGFLEFVAAIWAIAITGTALQKDQVNEGSN